MTIVIVKTVIMSSSPTPPPPTTTTTSITIMLSRFCSFTISFSFVPDRYAEELQQEKNDRAADKQTCVVLDAAGR